MPDYTIHTLDLQFQNRPEVIAAFLVLGPEAPVLIESGPGSTIPALTAALATHGVRPADVRDVLVTHIHLDHAGAAGWWAQQGARIHVHHIGAPHLIDPSKLLASAQRIYGARMQTLWGDFLPVPEDRLNILHGDDRVYAGGLIFTAYDTPGHARHHFVYRLDDHAFTGDVAGICIGARPHVRVPTPPPEFDLETWQTSITHMRAENFSRLYLTHCGHVDQVAAHWDTVAAVLTEYTQVVRTGMQAGLERDALIAHCVAWEEARLDAAGLDAEGRARYAGAGPMDMTVDGVARYWSKRLPAPGMT